MISAWTCWQPNRGSPRFRQDPPLALVLPMDGLSLSGFGQGMDAVAGSHCERTPRPFAPNQTTRTKSPQAFLDSRSPRRSLQEFLVDTVRSHAEAGPTNTDRVEDRSLQIS